MVVTQVERDQVLGILEGCNGKHQNTVIYHIARGMDCGTQRAGNLLRHVVVKGLARVEGFKVYKEEY